MSASALTFTAEAEALGKALRDIRQIVERTNTIPICGHVLIEAAGDSARLTVNNLSVSASRTVPITAATAGAITVPAHRFADVISAMERGAQVECKVGADRMQVLSGRSRFHFATLPATDFPAMPFEPYSGTAVLEMPARLLHDALSTVRHAISTEEVRYYLNGVFLHLVDGKLRFATTDGTRLALVAIDPPAGLSEMPGTIIGTETVNLIHKATADLNETVRLELSSDKVRFTAGGLEIVAKAVEGTYPDYTRVIPDNNDVVVEIDRDALASALARVLLANDDKTRTIKIAVANNMAVVRSNTSALDGQEEVPCEALLPRGAAEYGFNGRFLKDTLDALDVDTVEFRLAGPKDQALITSKSRPDATLVLMPIYI